MKLLPSEDFHILTPLNPIGVQEALEKEIRPVGGYTFKKMFVPRATGQFEGYVFDANFEITPVINYRNSFIPTIKGETTPHLNGSLVHVTMALNNGVAGFMYIWMGFASIGLISGIITAVKEQSANVAMWLMPLIMLVIAYVITLGGFKSESVGSRDKLCQILEGEVIKL